MSLTAGPLLLCINPPPQLPKRDSLLSSHMMDRAGISQKLHHFLLNLPILWPSCERPHWHLPLMQTTNCYSRSPTCTWWIARQSMKRYWGILFQNIKCTNYFLHIELDYSAHCTPCTVHITMQYRTLLQILQVEISLKMIYGLLLD